MSKEYKLVPVDPTEEMLIAGYATVHPDQLLVSAYKAMLAAAPQPPALGGEPGQLRDGYLIKLANIAAPHHDRDNDMFYIAMAKLVAAPLQAENKRLELMVAQYDHDTDHLYRERDQLKARCDELEGLLGKYFNNPAACAYKAYDIDAALSKPAGSEQV